MGASWTGDSVAAMGGCVGGDFAVGVPAWAFSLAALSAGGVPAGAFSLAVLDRLERE